jgi:predicted Zn-dependent protease
MQEHFYALADHIQSCLKGSEKFTAVFTGEESEFVRFNKSVIRQPGNVTQRNLAVDLIDGARHAGGGIGLTGDAAIDKQSVSALVSRLRDLIPHLPEDPHLLFATDVSSGEHRQPNKLPSPDTAMAAILDAGKGRDLVGIYAAGGVHAGFANSFGQRNWFSSYSFNFDWSFYHTADKAVKSGYAGFEWDDAAFKAKVDSAAERLAVLARPPRTVPPGKYRVYLSPSAMSELITTVCWGGFGVKDNRTKQSSLLRLIEGKQKLHESITIAENTADGVAPNFQSQGFIKPPKVVMIEGGMYKDPLVSPRSAKEYDIPTNGASDWETPESVDMAPGDIPASQVLERLGTGIYVGNLWYLNYSDRPACRITGMTRFATLWVENGVIQAPLSVMRFDETLYRILGENLVGLTAETEMILDPATYEQRSTSSLRLPGAVIEDFAFTL